jgi:hypothetical protein
VGLGSSAARQGIDSRMLALRAAALVAFLLLLVTFSVSGLHAAPSGATITFRKIFKSSYPEFVEIKVTESGAGTYDIRQLSDDPSPQPMELDPSVVQKIFGLAGKLRDFDGIQLEMHRRIANLGQKTFQYQLGAVTHSVNFNYTQNPTANQLLDIFESLARQQSDLADLRRAMQYDRLGVNDVLLQVQKDYDRNLLIEPQKFLASLDQVAADDRFINIAREKAHDLATRIRSSR